MSENASNPIVVETVVAAPIATVWSAWNEPAHIMKWAFASDDWHAPAATNDLKVGGNFTTTMAAKDGSMSFDFGGTYTVVDPNKQISYAMTDGRKVSIAFQELSNGIKVVETFDPESTHSREMQQAGWQAILNNFKSYAESLTR